MEGQTPPCVYHRQKNQWLIFKKSYEYVDKCGPKDGTEALIMAVQLQALNTNQ